MSRLVVFINGPARAGKDTVVQMAEDFFVGEDIFCSTVSSIDCVRFLLINAGVDVSRKTDEDRDLLSKVGMLLEEHCRFRSRATAGSVNGYFVGIERGVVFIHCREKSMMQRIKDSLDLHISTTTLYVGNPRAVVTASNASDQEAMLPLNYAHRIENEGTLNQLRNAVYDFCQKLIDDKLV